MVSWWCWCWIIGGMGSVGIGRTYGQLCRDMGIKDPKPNTRKYGDRYLTEEEIEDYRERQRRSAKKRKRLELAKAKK